MKAVIRTTERSTRTTRPSRVRAQHYDSDNLAIYGSQGSNGDYYIMGVDFWGLTDDTAHQLGLHLSQRQCL